MAAYTCGGMVARTGALGGTPGQGRGACLCLLSPVSILRPDVAYGFTGFAVAETAGAAQPRQVGRGGGQHCDRCYVELALLGHLLEVSSLVDWHGPEDCV